MPCGCAAKHREHQWAANGPGLVVRSLTVDPTQLTRNNMCFAHIHGQMVVVCVQLVRHGLLIFATALSIHKGLHSGSCILNVVPTAAEQHRAIRNTSDEGKVIGAGTFRQLLLSAGCGDVIGYGSTDEGAGIHSLTRFCTHKQQYTHIIATHKLVRTIQVHTYNMLCAHCVQYTVYCHVCPYDMYAVNSIV